MRIEVGRNLKDLLVTGGVNEKFQRLADILENFTGILEDFIKNDEVEGIFIEKTLSEGGDSMDIRIRKTRVERQ